AGIGDRDSAAIVRGQGGNAVAAVVATTVGDTAVVDHDTGADAVAGGMNARAGPGEAGVAAVGAAGVGDGGVAAGVGVQRVSEVVTVGDGGAVVDDLSTAGAAFGVDAERVVAAVAVGEAAIAIGNVDRIAALRLDAGTPVAAVADGGAGIGHRDITARGEDADRSACVAVEHLADRDTGVVDRGVAVGRIAVQADRHAVVAVVRGDGDARVGQVGIAVDRVTANTDG